MISLDPRGSVKSMQKSSQTLRDRAFAIINRKSFRRGQFTLSSGKQSEYYLDMKPSLLDPDGARILAELVTDILEDEDIDAVGELAVGAVPLVATVAMLSASRNRSLPGFFVRRAVKGHGTKMPIEGTADIGGKKVAVLDDVTTTGESAMIAVRSARDAGADVVLVLAVVDRQEGAPEFYRKEGIWFCSLFTASEFLRA